jgi:outer membrane protein OmpA-like peptidoglycan-associated protein
VKSGEGGGSTSRGCQPLEAKKVAAMSAGDFNALFLPMAQRAGIVQFEKDKAELDAEGQALLDKVFADQRGASYFLVVSRASPEGSVEHNRVLSEKRAGAALDHLKAKYNDPDLEREVGLLWLGEEFAQLDKTFCAWNRSHPEECDAKTLNRSAFIAWIDCHL